MAHPSHERTQPFYPKENVSEPSPFDAVSTMSASFLPWPLPRAAGPMKRAKGELDLGWSRALPTGTTVHRDAFTELRLPPGCKATLGVQVTPGEFHPMIAKGRATPVQKTQLFTTVVDEQEIIQVVVIAMADVSKPSHGMELGRFALGRLQPLKKGVVQVEVSMYLSSDNSIRVSAHNLQTEHSASINIRDKFRLATF